MMNLMLIWAVLNEGMEVIEKGHSSLSQQIDAPDAGPPMKVSRTVLVWGYQWGHGAVMYVGIHEVYARKVSSCVVFGVVYRTVPHSSRVSWLAQHC